MATARFSALRLFSPPPRTASSTLLRPPLRLFFPSTTTATGHLPLSYHPRSRYGPSPSRPLTVVFAVGKILETELLPVPSDPEGFKDANIPTGAGVYGIYDSNEALQFLGISRNIAGSVLLHKKALPELCCSVKAGVVDEPASDSSILTDAWKSWMQEHIDSTGQVPPGNQTGNTTWQRRRQNKPDLRLTPGRHVQLTVPLEELIDRLVKENKVVAFIKGSRNAPQCGFSQRVVGILESHGVVYHSVNVLDEEYNYGLREKLKQYSNWPTFPQIFVDGELIGGCDILSAMDERGEISKLLGQSG